MLAFEYSKIAFAVTPVSSFPLSLIFYNTLLLVFIIMLVCACTSIQRCGQLTHTYNLNDICIVILCLNYSLDLPDQVKYETNKLD